MSLLLPNDPAVARRVLSAYELPDCDPILATTQGIANTTWMCDGLVVRICKDADYLTDLYTESVAAPVALAAGLVTPQLRHFSLVPVGDLPPHSVYERILGSCLSKEERIGDPTRFFELYGESLRLMQDKVCEVDDPENYLDPPWELSLTDLEQAAHLLGLDLKLINDLWDETAAETRKVFSHQDLHANNVLVDQNERPVFIDWGDAGFADPSVDFRYVPLRYLSHAIKGYGAPAPVSGILLHAIDQMAYQMRMNCDYGPYGASSADDLAAFINLQS